MIYAGETIRIKSSAKGLNGVSLTNLDVTSVKVTLFDSSGTQILPPTSMSYDSVNVQFYYDWNTAAVAAGAYKAKVTYEGVGFSSWEYLSVRLKPNPV